jgi:DNA integrity scanning protein DisA with diadenylate cyclase activity
MTKDAFSCKCIAETLDGIRDGLTHFSAPSRVAVIYCLRSTDPVYIYDPQNLLRGHEPKFKELYLDSDDWRHTAKPDPENSSYSNMLPEKNLQLAGLISYGGRSGPVFYQMWFTEHHPDMCAIGPTERWLEHAAWRFSHDIANDEALYTGISGSFLREYATHAVRDYLIDQMNILLGWDTQLRIYPILDTILGISRTREEGAWPRGELIFVEHYALREIDFVARFPKDEQPNLENFKHIRKLLLAVEQSQRKLVSDGHKIVGIAIGNLPEFSIIADFRGNHGFLKLNMDLVCSFSDGAFKSTTYQAKLVHLEEALLESKLDASHGNTLFRIITAIVHHAETQKHGCTIVVDLNEQPVPIAGQGLESPLDLQQPDNLELTKSLSKVDGALHIGSDLKLHGFACLLDGRSIPGEDRARGARYNSALRFTAERDNILVVVVSADRPVSVIMEGVEVSAQCQWKPVSSCIFQPLPLEAWIANERL